LKNSERTRHVQLHAVTPSTAMGTTPVLFLPPYQAR